MVISASPACALMISGFTSALEMVLFSKICGKRHDQGDQAFRQMEKSVYISNLKQDVYAYHMSTNTSGTLLQPEIAFFINLVVKD